MLHQYVYITVLWHHGSQSYHSFIQITAANYCWCLMQESSQWNSFSLSGLKMKTLLWCAALVSGPSRRETGVQLLVWDSFPSHHGVLLCSWSACGVIEPLWWGQKIREAWWPPKYTPIKFCLLSFIPWKRKRDHLSILHLHQTTKQVRHMPLTLFYPRHTELWQKHRAVGLVTRDPEWNTFFLLPYLA